MLLVNHVRLYPSFASTTRTKPNAIIDVDLQYKSANAIYISNAKGITGYLEPCSSDAPPVTGWTVLCLPSRWRAIRYSYRKVRQAGRPVTSWLQKNAASESVLSWKTQSCGSRILRLTLFGILFYLSIRVVTVRYCYDY